MAEEWWHSGSVLALERERHQVSFLIYPKPTDVHSPERKVLLPMCVFEKYSSDVSEDAGVGALSQRSWAASESGAWAQEMVVVLDKGVDTLLDLWGANRDLELVERGTEICSRGTQPSQLTAVQEDRWMQGNSSVLAEACVAAAQEQVPSSPMKAVAGRS